MVAESDPPFVVTDRRRVTAAGPKPRPTTSSLPAIPYKGFRNAVEGTWRHVDTHLERGVMSDSLKPSLLWIHVRGLALSSRQTYNAVALLLADRNKPNTLPLQAAILIRSMLEGLGNI